MHILLLSHRFDHPNGGGTEVLTADLADALSNQGHHVTWVAADEVPAGRESSGKSWASIPVEPLAGPGDVHWPAAERVRTTRLLPLLRRLPPVDSVHVMHFSRVGLGLLDAQPLRRVPVVATFTDYTLACPDHHLWVRHRAALCRSTAPTDDCLQCLGQPRSSHSLVAAWRKRNVSWLNERVRAFWLQTPHQAEEFAAVGVDMGKLVSDRAVYTVPASWGTLRHHLHPGEPYVLFMGRCSPEKGLDVLIDAFRTRPGRLRLLVLAMPDDPGYEAVLRQRAAAHPHIDWRPPLSRERLEPLLAGAAALLVPSQCYDNHPLVLEEARALGVPTWCSAVSSLRHLANEPGVHLVEEYSDPKSWSRVLSAIAASTGAGSGAAGRKPRITQCREKFARFVNGITEVYRREAAHG